MRPTKPMNKIVIEAMGNDDDLAVLVHTLKTIENLCRQGTSRCVEIIVDGDGSAALKFAFLGTDTSEVPPKDPDSDLKFYIGE